MIASALRRLTVGERTGLGAFGAALALAPVDIRLALLPLLAFILVCLAESFRPASSFFLPVISRGPSAVQAVALTFDDGPDPRTTPVLLRLLAAHGASATFFVNGRRASRYPELTARILAEGHALANHSYTHPMLAAFKGTQTMAHEIEATQAAIRAAGAEALAYRPPMGITGPRLARLMRVKRMFVVNFSCRAFDGGNRRVRDLSGRILSRVRAGDIVLLHDIVPTPSSLLPYWANEVDRVIRGIREKGLAILPLAELIGKPVMIRAGGVHSGGGGPAR